MFLSQGTSCIGCNHRTFGAQWSGCAPQRSLAKQTLVDQPAAHVRRFVELPKVSFQAQGFYSPQKLSATDAMDVMEAYMASTMAEMQVRWSTKMKKSDEISWKKHQLCNSKWKKNMLNSSMVSRSRHVSIGFFLSMIFFSEVTSLAPNPLAKKCIVNSRWLGTVCWRLNKKQRSGQNSEADKIRILMKNIGTFVLFWKQLMMIENM